MHVRSIAVLISHRRDESLHVRIPSGCLLWYSISLLAGLQGLRLGRVSKNGLLQGSLVVGYSMGAHVCGLKKQRFFFLSLLSKLSAIYKQM